MSTDIHTKLVEQLALSVSKHLCLQMEAMFACAENTVITLPESCGISKKACKYALRSLELSKANIISNYTQYIDELLKPVNSNQVMETSSEVLNEFVKQDEVDVMVAMTSIYSKALSESKKSLQQLETRLEYLEIATDDSFDMDAVSPKRLCETFHKVLEASGVNNSHGLVLFQLYDQTINSNLTELYEELNSMLIEANVLPDIIMGNHTEDGEVSGVMQTRTVNYYDPLANKAEHFIERSDNEMNYFAMNYMSGDMTVSPDAIDLPDSFKTAPSYEEIEGKNCYARKDVVVALSKLQQALIAQDADDGDFTPGSCSVDIGIIKSSLFNSMHVEKDSRASAAEKHVNLLDERSIDFVGMMFDVMAEDDFIPPLIKAQLMRLQISVIKVSITDKTLFENEQHPVRSVLNLITEVGQGVSSEEEDVYKKVSSVISKLLKEYYMDITSFKRAEKELKALLSRKDASLKKVEQEEHRKIIKEHARNVVLTELKCLSAKKTIPKSVQPLVLKHLPTLMINQYVLHGRDSEQWNTSTALLKRLIQCLQPLKKNDDWLHLKENEPALLNDLTTTLCKTSQDKQTIQALMQSLKGLFLDMIYDFGFKNVEDTSNAENLSDIVNEMEILDANSLSADMPSSVSSSMKSTEQPLSEAEQVLQEALFAAQTKIKGLPEQVHPGVWFEIYNGEEHAVRRLKLSVILNDTAKVVFSDRRGNTVMEKDAGDFTEELATNKSRMIADHSTFDNALGSVIASLVA